MDIDIEKQLGIIRDSVEEIEGLLYTPENRQTLSPEDSAKSFGLVGDEELDFLIEGLKTKIANLKGMFRDTETKLVTLSTPIVNPYDLTDDTVRRELLVVFEAIRALAREAAFGNIVLQYVDDIYTFLNDSSAYNKDSIICKGIGHELAFPTIRVDKPLLTTNVILNIFDYMNSSVRILGLFFTHYNKETFTEIFAML